MITHDEVALQGVGTRCIAEQPLFALIDITIGTHQFSSAAAKIAP